MKRSIDRLKLDSEIYEDYQQEVPEIDAFLLDIFEVYKKHDMAISHEDGQGGFIIEHLHQDYIDWLNCAADGREV